MKKLMIFGVALLAGSFLANAQEWDEAAYQAQVVELEKKVAAPWTISAGIGAEVYCGENDRKVSFGQQITFPALELNVTKWFNPYIGLGLTATGYKMQGLWCSKWTTNPHFKTSEIMPEAQTISTGDKAEVYLKQSGNYFNAFVAASFNLCNIIGGYKADRVYSLIPYVGVGLIYDITDSYASTSLNGGLINSFRINDSWNVNLTARAAVLSDKFDGEVSDIDNVPFDAIGTVTVGFTYKFGVAKAKSQLAALAAEKEAALAALAAKEAAAKAAAEAAAAKAAADKLAAEKAAAEKLAAEKLAAEKAAAEAARAAARATTENIQFKIGKYAISKDEAAKIDSIVKVLNDYPEAVVCLSGYADKETGSSKSNMTLSKNRAEAVAKALVAAGIDESRISTEYFGDTVNPFNTPEQNRVVVTVTK